MTSQRNLRRFVVISSTFILCSSFSSAQSASTPPPVPNGDPYQINLPKQEPPKPVVIPNKKISDKGKTELIRGLTAELGYARKPFPFGKVGLTLKNGKVTHPDEEQMAQIMASYGAAVKVGDRAQITKVTFKDKAIVMEINGGPVRREKWYEHIQVMGAGGVVSPGQPTEQTNIHGSYVELAFDKFVPDLTADQVKQLLDPVLNFHAKSATQAYLETIPPKAKQAINDHRVLVGMDREMVTYALGRPPQKYRDKDGDTDYEEWIYGAPPQDVQFIRFVGDEVVRVETMKVDGTKMVRTEREITIQPEQPQVAQQQQPGVPGQAPGQTQTASTSDSSQGPRSRPTLRRPGEDQTATPNDGSMPTNPGANIPDTTSAPDPSQNPGTSKAPETPQ